MNIQRNAKKYYILYYKILHFIIINANNLKLFDLILNHLL